MPEVQKTLDICCLNCKYYINITCFIGVLLIQYDWTAQACITSYLKFPCDYAAMDFLKGLPYSSCITSYTRRFGTVFSPVCSLGVATGTFPQSRRSRFVIWATRSPFHIVHLHSGGVPERPAAAHPPNVCRSTLPWLPSTPLL